MPATRSRTEHWRRSLQQICERNGALEITLPRFFPDGDASGSDQDPVGRNLIWRVRILSVSDTEIVVEQPSTLGQPIRLEDGIDLIGVIAVGQNRWMFETRNLGRVQASLTRDRVILAHRLQMPTRVERCQRRSFYRISTVGLELPEVDCRAVLDPKTLVAAEAASQARIELLEDSNRSGLRAEEPPLVTPETGPALAARLINVGGGGAGLLIEPGHAQGLEGRRLFWLSINLLPHIPAPLAVAARLAHTHIDSEQRTYAGMAFDFSHNPGHMRFVVDRICRYVTVLQREQLQRRAAVER